MKKIWLCTSMFLLPMITFAESVVRDDEIATLFKAIGCFFLFLLIPGIIIGIICAGIRTIRGWLNI